MIQGPVVHHTTISARQIENTQTQNLKLLKQKIGKGATTRADDSDGLPHLNHANNNEENSHQRFPPNAIFPKSSEVDGLKPSLSFTRRDRTKSSEDPIMDGSTVIPLSQSPKPLHTQKRLIIEHKSSQGKDLPSLDPNQEKQILTSSSNNEISKPLTRTTLKQQSQKLFPMQPSSPEETHGSRASPARVSSMSAITPAQRRQSQESATSNAGRSSISSTIVSTRRFEIGLKNLGNTCFMNSSLQCLLHIEPLVSYFLNQEYEHDLNPNSPMRGQIATSFAQLTNDMQRTASSAGSFISPVAFQKTVGNHAPHLLDYQQQDAQEFLRFLLDGLSEDLCRARPSTESEKAVEPSGPASESPLESPLRHSSLSVIRRPSSSLHYLEQSRVEAERLSGEFQPLNEHEEGFGSNNRSSESNSSNSNQNNGIDKRRPYSIRKRASNRKSNSQKSSELILDSDGESSPVDVPSQKSSPVERELTTTSQLQPINSITRLRSITKASRTNIKDNEDSGNTQNDMNAFPNETSSGKESKVDNSVNSDVKSTTDSSANGSVPDRRTSVDDDPISASNNSVGSAVPEENISTSLVNSAKSLIMRRRRKSTEVATGKAGEDSGGVAGAGRQSPTPSPTPATPLSIPISEKILGKQPFSVIRSISLNGSIRSSMMGKEVKEKEVEREQQVLDPMEEQRLRELRLKVYEEGMKAWQKYIEKNASIIIDIFAGQLQSTVECEVCKNRSSCFDPFLDLSVPIPKICELTTTPKGWRKGSSSEASRCTLDECLEKLIGEEVLEGDNMVECEKCKMKTRSSRKLFIFRYPRVLVIHIKRFRFSTYNREKLSTDVTFPLSGFDLSPYLSPDVKVNDANPSPVYDLVGISNHSGSLNGGHYIAHVDTSGGAGNRWMCFNDARVSTVNTSSLSGPSAYVLFYQLRS